MRRYLSIDGGTTNTRLSLVTDGKIVDTVKYSVGARTGIDDKSALCCAIKGGIQKLLDKNSLSESDIEKILASGMITSDSGLVSLPHLSLPAGIKELKEATCETVLPEISKIPFVFIRGVKTAGSSLDTQDLMRGEETELFGIAEDFGATYLLPGSHNKIIRLNEDGKIISFKTTLLGELVFSLASHTILKDSFSLDFEDFNSEYLKKGCDYAKKSGINEALFKTRVLKNSLGASENESYSFFLGACLAGELTALEKSGAQKIIIGGKRQLKNALCVLLEEAGLSAKVISDEAVDASVVRGQIKIYEYGEKQ